VAKVRVYELAKELGVESKTVLSMLKDMGEFVRSASSTVEAPVERRLKEKLASEPPPVKKPPAKKAAAKKADGEQATSATAAAVVPVEVPPATAPTAPTAKAPPAPVAPATPAAPVAAAPAAPPVAPTRPQPTGPQPTAVPRPGVPRNRPLPRGHVRVPPADFLVLREDADPVPPVRETTRSHPRKEWAAHVRRVPSPTAPDLLVRARLRAALHSRAVAREFRACRDLTRR
jgi:hypothetical protein